MLLQHDLAFLLSQPGHPYRELVVIPASKTDINSSVVEKLARFMQQRSRLETGSAKVPGTAKDEQPASQPQQPEGLRIQRPTDDFGVWLRSDTTLSDMGRRFDALEHNTKVVAAPIILPTCRVTSETPDFCNSKRFKNWDFYSRKHKHSIGVITLSDVIFSLDGKYAVFYVSVCRGMSDGVGFYAFMEKNAQGWRTKFTQMLWIS